MNKRLGAVGVFLSALVLNGCGEETASREDIAARATPRDAWVSVNGVRLQYLDWGGEGPPLVLVHGMGDSPHIFDDLAEELRDDFRVIAYGRRGHARSDAPDSLYDNATLVQDLRELMDSLHVAEAILLGWSMGGNEITEFAGRFPTQTLGLVYLESGYDWSDPAFGEALAALPVAFDPDSTALSSLDIYRDWYHHRWFPDTRWTPGLEAHLSDITRVEADGSVRSIPEASTYEKIVASAFSCPRDYGAVQAPALALYSTAFFDPDPTDPASGEALAAWERDHMEPFRAASIERIQRELPHVKVERVPGTNHASIGVKDPAGLAERIRDFLLAG